MCWTPCHPNITDTTHSPLSPQIVSDMRNHRAKLRDAIVDMTLRSPELLDPLSPTLSIADHARHLIEHYRFLDASYVSRQLFFSLVH